MLRNFGGGGISLLVHLLFHFCEGGAPVLSPLDMASLLSLSDNSSGVGGVTFCLSCSSLSAKDSGAFGMLDDVVNVVLGGFGTMENTPVISDIVCNNK